ncbi:unnamed protein product [Euphydryas editha]|uniref:Transposable element P transposase-like RNase H C-terminal domain-containing protein n=1 Tax=Euphydryas editha TaxID=104508 RepID=A0AAU9V5L7_EUPED|nr:unnamed protein product [Euphydryas editha]
MKVKLATQTLRRSVAKAMKRAKYVIMHLYKKIVEARSKTVFIGALINIESLKLLTEHVIVKEESLVFLPTYKPSQDHLEIFFSCVRMCGGHNDNPNVKQFKGTYRKLLTHLELRSLETGNCVLLENVSILTCSSAIQVINSTSPSYRHEELDDTELRFLSEISADAELDTLARSLDVPIMNEMRKMINTTLPAMYPIAGSVCFIGNDKIYKEMENAHECHGADYKVSLIKVIVEKFLSIRFHHIAKLETTVRSVKVDAKREYFKKLLQNKGV